MPDSHDDERDWPLPGVEPPSPDMPSTGPERCAVRPFEEGDVELLLPLLAPEAGTPADGLPRPWGARDAGAWASRVLEDQAAGRALVFVVIATGRGAVGTTKLGQIDPERRAGELSYWIAEPHRGRGFGTAAARRTVAYAFGPGALVELRAHALEQNAASRAILARLGFRRVGTVESARTSGGGEPAPAILRLLLEAAPWR